MSEFQLRQTMTGPAGELDAAQCRATEAWQGARQTAWVTEFADHLWTEAKLLARAEHDVARAMKLAGDTEAAFHALAIWPMPLRLAVRDADLTPGPERVEKLRAAMAAQPATAAFQARIDARHAAVDAARDVERQQASDRFERAAPGLLLAKLHERGVRLTLSADGRNVTLPADQMGRLSREDVETIRRHKPAIVALLMAAAKAAAPMVVV